MANPNPMFLSRTRPFSLRHARSLFGVSDPAKIALLVESLIGDYGTVREECCFALDTNKWTTAVTAGGGPTAFAYSAVRGGTFQGQTGATDNDATAIHAANTFLDPADMPFFICRFKINAVTGVSIEVGMSDPKSDEALPGVTDVDTPTVGNGVTDIACLHMDTDQDLTTLELVGDGTTGSAALSDSPSLTDAAFTPTADTYQTWLVGVRPNLSYALVFNGEGQIGSFSVANGPDSGVLVRPYALFRTRNTVSKTIDIDSMFYGWERNG